MTAGAKTCRAHCSGCGSHFAGISAFDTHRVGPPEARVCLDPLDATNDQGKRRYEPLTEDGECRMYAVLKTGVTVWSLAGSRASAEKFRSALALSPDPA